MKSILNIPLLLFFLLCTIDLNARTILVHPGNGLPITNAIKNAFPGDTLLVQSGIYSEPTIHVNKPLFIIGQGYPKIDGKKKNEIMVIESDHVYVEALHFIHSGRSGYNDIAALRLLNCGNATIIHNKFDDTFFGIYAQHAYHSRISHNKFISSGTDEINSANGIHCWKSDSLIIEHNDITGHRDGIYFEFVTRTTIRNNYSHQNVRYGLHFMFSHNNLFYQNIFSQNGSGVAVMYSHGVRMINNVFRENQGTASYGILMKDISDSKVQGNYFSSNTTSIYMEGSSRIDISSNHFMNNGWAMKIQASCNDNVISKNDFSGNTFDVGTNGTMVLNTFDGNYWDRYEGYDLNRNGVGDIPYRPVSLYSMIVERNPTSLMLFRSFLVGLMDRAEKIIPSFTPEQLMDHNPSMKPLLKKMMNP